MKISRYAFSVFFLTTSLLVLALTAKTTSFSNESTLADCPVTTPPEPPLMPPAAFPERPPGTYFWYGSEALWTALPAGSTWSQLPRDEHGYYNKLPFWSVDFDVEETPYPDLVVRARRLDGSASVYEGGRATNGYSSDSGQFMLTGVNLATSGCWEISGSFQDASLTFIIWVSP
jgi:hypothetical protein